MAFAPSVSRARVDRAHREVGTSSIMSRGSERQPSCEPSPQEPVPLGRLQEVAREAFEQVIAARGRDKLQASMGACDDLAAAQLARGLREMSSEASIQRLITASSLGVAESMRPVFERLLDPPRPTWTVRKGLRRAIGQLRRLTTAADSADRILRSFICESFRPSCRGLCSAPRTARNSDPCCAAKRRPCKSCSPARERICWIISTATGFSPASGWRAIAAAVQEAARHLPEGRGLRILEVGAGTGGLTSLVLPLLERGSAFLYFQRRVCGILFRGDAEAGGLSRGRVQDLRSRKAGHGTGLRSRRVRSHSRRQCASCRQRSARGLAEYSRTAQRREAVCCS